MLFDMLKGGRKQLFSKKADIFELTGEIYPQKPRVKLLQSNGFSAVLCDSGSGFLRLFENDILKVPSDLLRDAKGIFCHITLPKEELCTTLAPDYYSGKGVTYETAFSKSAVTYFAHTDYFKVATQVRLHTLFPCLQLEITLQNMSGGELSPSLAFSFEQGKGGLSVGFLENVSFEVEEGEHTVIKLDTSLGKNAVAVLHLVLAAGKNERESACNLKMARKLPPIDNMSSAESMLVCDSVAERILKTLLPQLLFLKRDTLSQTDAAEKNSLPALALNAYGIDTKIPIVTVDIYSAKDSERLNAYIECKKTLVKSGINFFLLFLYDSGTNSNELIATVTASIGGDKPLKEYAVGFLNKGELSSDILRLCYAASCHVATRSLVRIEAPVPPYAPIKALTIGVGSAFEDFLAIDCGMVAICREGSYQNLIDGMAQKSTGDINVYSGLACGLDTSVEIMPLLGAIGRRVIISVTNNDKRVAVFAAALYCEPLFGVDRGFLRMLRIERTKNALLFFQPNAIDMPYLAIGADTPFAHCLDRAAFLSGRWNGTVIQPEDEVLTIPTATTARPDCCGAVILRQALPKGETMTLQLLASLGKTREDALKPFL